MHRRRQKSLIWLQIEHPGVRCRGRIISGMNGKNGWKNGEKIKQMRARNLLIESCLQDFVSRYHRKESFGSFSGQVFSANLCFFSQQRKGGGGVSIFLFFLMQAQISNYQINKAASTHAAKWVGCMDAKITERRASYGSIHGTMDFFTSCSKYLRPCSFTMYILTHSWSNT